MKSAISPVKTVNKKGSKPEEKALSSRETRQLQNSPPKGSQSKKLFEKVSPSSCQRHELNKPACVTCKDGGQQTHRSATEKNFQEYNSYLCSSGTKKHRTIANERHLISPSSQTMSETVKHIPVLRNGYHPFVCTEEEHKYTPKYFCETCENIACLECVENLHKKHNFLYVKDAYAKHKTALEQHIEKARREALQILKQLEREDRALRKLKDERDDIIKKIKGQTALLMEALCNQQRQLLTDLDKMYADKEEIVSRNKERCQNRLELINRTCRFTETALNDANESQVLLFKKYAMKRLEELCRPETLMTDTKDINIKYFTGKTSVDGHKFPLGQLVETSADPNHCVAQGEGLACAVVGQEACFVVTTKDKNDLPLSMGGDDVQVRIWSAQDELISSCIFDEGNSNYTVTYTPGVTGKITISILVYGQAIKKSEFQANVFCQRDYCKITEPVLTIPGLSHSGVVVRLKLPCGVAVDQKGRIFIADCHNHCIKITGPDGKFVKSFGTFGNKNGQMNNPTDVAISQGKVYVCDKDNNRIQCFTLEGVFLKKFSRGCGNLKRPWGVCVDRRGNVLVVDTKNNRIQVFSEEGSFVTSFGAEGSEDSRFRQPYFAAVHQNGNIYITDNGNHRVQVFSDSYSYLFNFGREDGELGLKNPTGIVTDNQGIVIVADQCNSRLQVFGQDGTRKAVVSGPLNNTHNQSYPKGLAVTQNGYIVVADSDNDRIVLL